MTIAQWIKQGCDYKQGVQLYGALPVYNKVLLRHFTKKQTPTLAQKLFYELSKIDKSQKSIPQNKSIKVSSSSIKQTTLVQAQKPYYTPVVMADLPKQLRPVLERANGLFKTNCRLKIDLNECKPEQEENALDIIRKIAANFKENKTCWGQIDFYLEHKEFIPTQSSEIDKLSPAELVKREGYKYTSISKAKKKIESNLTKLDTSLPVNTRTRIEKATKRLKRDLLIHEQELVLIQNKIHGTDRD